VRYLHSEINSIQRIEILQDLREGKFDVLIEPAAGRIDLPEVSSGNFDADKEGFCGRSDR